MYQEIEGNRPVVMTRNHNARVRPDVYRWHQPADYMSAWSVQRCVTAGAIGGLFSASMMHLWNPMYDMLHFYQAPDNLGQLSTFMGQITKMETFRNGYLGRLMLHVAYGATFNASRMFLWHSIAGGYAHQTAAVSSNWPKDFVTAAAVGAMTCWMPVPFHNLERRFAQDQILPKEHARGYRSPMSAAVQILAKDGMYPLVRGAGPLMGEAFMQTTFLFSSIVFLKDKMLPLRSYGFEFDAGMPYTPIKFAFLTGGVFTGLFFSYPFRVLRQMVEELPKNSKGEKFFKTYSEAWWKFRGESFDIISLWNGFNRHLVKAGLPLFGMLWIAESMGLLDWNTREYVYVDN